MGNYQATIPGSPIILIFLLNENRFIDEDGKPIYNVFEMITPNDLLIFRNDPGITMFRHRDIPRMYVEIVEEEEHYAP